MYLPNQKIEPYSDNVEYQTPSSLVYHFPSDEVPKMNFKDQIPQQEIQILARDDSKDSTKSKKDKKSDSKKTKSKSKDGSSKSKSKSSGSKKQKRNEGSDKKKDDKKKDHKKKDDKKKDDSKTVIKRDVFHSATVGSESPSFSSHRETSTDSKSLSHHETSTDSKTEYKSHHETSTDSKSLSHYETSTDFKSSSSSYHTTSTHSKAKDSGASHAYYPNTGMKNKWIVACLFVTGSLFSM